MATKKTAAGKEIRKPYEAPVDIVDDKLTQLTTMIRTLLRKADEIEEAEAVLKVLNEEARVLREEDIPSFMRELELDELVMKDTGEKIKRDIATYAAISVANREKAFEWLEKNAFDGIIKGAIVIDIGKGEIEKAEQIIQLLAANEHNGQFIRNVHPQTLLAFVRERIAKEGEDPEVIPKLPMELFGARTVETTKVTKPKAKKA